MTGFSASRQRRAQTDRARLGFLGEYPGRRAARRPPVRAYGEIPGIGGAPPLRRSHGRPRGLWLAPAPGRWGGLPPAPPTHRWGGGGAKHGTFHLLLVRPP